MSVQREPSVILSSPVLDCVDPVTVWGTQYQSGGHSFNLRVLSASWEKPKVRMVGPSVSLREPVTVWGDQMLVLEDPV